MHEAQKHSNFRELSGTIVSRFRVIRILGVGGMGQVYQAEDLKLKRLVAIKRMAPQSELSAHDRESLLREAQRASALNHPNIASIYDVVEDGDELFVVMECVDGTSLRQKTTAGHTVTLDEFFDIGEQCAAALAAAHEQSILHADIKPDNIMLTPTGRVKILDFGVARKFTLVDEQQATSSLDSLAFSSSGTPAYMPPEVLTQRPYDGRADLFSLGVVFYEMLCGQHPFRADSMAGTVGRVLHEEPLRLSEVNPKVGTQLSNLVGHMLAKDPERRYPSARALIDDLRRIKAGEKPKSTVPVVATPSRLWTPLTIGLVAALAALTLVAGGLVWWLPRSSHSETPGTAVEQRADASAKTLAVLPFDAVVDDAKMTAFGNGLVDSLTAKLTQLSENHRLQVVSADEIRKKSVLRPEQARQEFGADLGLKVALQRSGDLVHVTYTVTDTKTNKVVKTESLDAPVTDPFSIEDKVANGVASALRIQLTAEDRRLFAFHGTNDPNAFNYYTQARGYLEDASNPSNADSAVILLSEAVRTDPNYGKAEAELGTAYWSKFQTTKDKKFIALARGACQKAVAAGNAGASGHVCLGVLENGTGSYEKATEQFKHALELEPTNDEAYIGLASAYERLQNPGEAESTYKRVVKLRPTYWKGYNLLGGFYARQGQFDQAVQMFQKVVELTPESFRGYANLGATYLYQTRYQEAIKSLQQSLAIRPTAATYSNLGTAYYHTRQFGEAAKIYQLSVRLDDKSHTTWGNLGEALYLSGKRDEARAAYSKAIEVGMQELKVNAHDPQLLKDMADYNAMLGNREKALQYLSNALEYSKFDKETLFAAALIHNQLGETGLALEWLRKALQAGYSLETMKDSPSVDNLRTNPQFQELISSK